MKGEIQDQDKPCCKPEQVFVGVHFPGAYWSTLASHVAHPQVIMEGDNIGCEHK